MQNIIKDAFNEPEFYHVHLLTTCKLVTITGSERCADLRGDGKYVYKCKFPFRAWGKWYDSCTREDGKVMHPVPWCATVVDENNISVSGQWGNCAPPDSSECQISMSKLVCVGKTLI